MFQPSSSPSEPPSIPLERTASSAWPTSMQDASAQRAGSMQAIRRRPAAKHAEHQPQRSSVQGSSRAVSGTGYGRREGVVQQDSPGQPEQLSLSAPPADYSSNRTHNGSSDRDTEHASTSAPALPSKKAATGNISLDEQSRSMWSQDELSESGSTERVRSRAERARMHPMLAAIQHLAHEVERGDRQAALQRLAAIRSICQAGLAGAPCPSQTQMIVHLDSESLYLPLD